MAGIGFELRKLLARESYAGVLGAYGYAGLASSGPWVVSIGGVLAIGLLAHGTVQPAQRVTQFLVSITWLMAASLLLTGPLQLLFARFVADRIYEEQRSRILPNLLGALALTTITSGLLGALVAFGAFDESIACRALFHCFAPSCRKFAARQRSQCVDVNQNQLRLMKRADEILAGRHIHCRLPAN